jgi:endonuclease/exonuclease/phosphatase family metal-dependent hydrolase
MLKLMTLNLWCYFDWENRKDNIKSVIKRLEPDIIAFQEVQTNRSFSPWSQSDLIADDCDFKYRVFAPTYRRTGQIDKDGGMTQEVSFGLALISKYPIISSETHFLRRHPDYDEACSVLFTKLNINNQEVDICNVHFGNSDLFSDLHLKELMDLCNDRKIKPIILGDFNNFHLDIYANNILQKYSSSADNYNYESMPKNYKRVSMNIQKSLPYAMG